MIRNMAAKVHKVAQYGFEVHSSLIDDVCRAHALINKYISTRPKYCEDVQRNLKKVEFDRYGSRIIESSISLFMAN
jgi:hypothetical protein